MPIGPPQRPHPACRCSSRANGATASAAPGRADAFGPPPRVLCGCARALSPRGLHARACTGPRFDEYAARSAALAPPSDSRRDGRTPRPCTGEQAVEEQ
eukprot:1863580-Prymnesium_polylepis.1